MLTYEDDWFKYTKKTYISSPNCKYMVIANDNHNKQRIVTCS